MVKKNNQKNKLKLNSVYSNFKLIFRKKDKNIDSYINIFKHQKINTELIFIENDDIKRAFQISFRTPSNNSKGIQHIIEHAVLRGSRKYNFGNVETFAKILQNSIISFLNAGTYPDKTVYHFSTNLESEFFKVMDIYLDSVFFPNLLNNKNFFRQEGWRYEKNENGDIVYNGVVFNEMKGVLASAPSLNFERIVENIFKDTQNKYNSGGDPNEIVDLTWEELKEYYKKNYHPTNANIYVYGKLDIFEVLEKIENEFLSEFKKKGKKAEKIKIQKNFKSFEKVEKFQTSEKNKASYMSISFLGKKINEWEENILKSFLVSFLTWSENSILKRNILDSKLVNMFSSGVENDMFQTFVGFNFEGIEYKDRKKIEKIFYSSLEKIVEEGIDRKVLKSFLSSFEYSLILNKYNNAKGISIIESIDRYKVFDMEFDNIFDKKKVVALLKKIIKLDKKDKNSFESIIKNTFLKKKSSFTFVLKADPKFNPYKKLDKKLEKINKNKKSKKILEIEEEIKEYEEYLKNNSIASKILPPKKSQIPKKPQKNKSIKKIVKDKKDKVDITYYFSQIPEKNIKKIVLSFDARTVSEDDLQYYQLIEKVIDFLPIGDKTRSELEVERNNIFGSFSIYNVIGQKLNSNNEIYSRFNISIGYLTRNEKKVFQYLNNLLNNLKFDLDVVKERIDILIKLFKNSISNNGHEFADKRAFSKISVLGKIKEKVSGIDFLLFLEKVKKDIEEKPEEVTEKMKNIFDNIISKNNLAIILTANKKDFSISEKLDIKNKKLKINKYKNIGKKENEAIIFGTLTNAFSGLIADYKKSKVKVNKKTYILQSLLTYDYLWKKIREQGGAYGAGFNLSLISEVLSLFSYMDSRISGTYKDFMGVSKFLQNFEKESEISDIEMDEKIRGLIATTLGSFLEPISLISASYEKFVDDMSEYDEKERGDIIKEILLFDKNDFKKIGLDLEKVLKNNVKVTIGPKDKIEKDKKEFNKIWELK